MSNAIKHVSDHSQEFHVQIVGKHLEVTNALREFILEKLTKFEAIVKDIIDVHVKLEVNKNETQNECLIRMKFSHFNVTVHAITTDMYASIEKAFDRLFTKVRKWKTKIQDHHGKGIAMQEMRIHVLEHAGDAELAQDEEIVDMNNDSLKTDFAIPKIAKEKTRQLKTLTMDEALMKIELSGDHFLVFNCEEEHTLKVIYRRRNGSYGVIIPQ